jgi:uncharacterized protein YwbE
VVKALNLPPTKPPISRFSTQGPSHTLKGLKVQRVQKSQRVEGKLVQGTRRRNLKR